MRKRHVRNRLDFRHLEYSKIGLPLVESIQRIMIRAEIFGQTLPANRLMEHPAQRHPIDDAAVDAKPNQATRTLVHHNENPMCFQCGGFASEQIATPQTILRVAEKREPGWTSRFRPVMNAQEAGQFESARRVSRARLVVEPTGGAPDLELLSRTVRDKTYRGRRVPLFPELGHRELTVFTGVQETILEEAREGVRHSEQEPTEWHLHNEGTTGN